MINYKSRLQDTLETILEAYGVLNGFWESVLYYAWVGTGSNTSQGKKQAIKANFKLRLCNTSLQVENPCNV